MSDDRMEPLDPELLVLAEAERQRPGISAEVQERLSKRLSGAVATGGGAGGPGGGAGTPGSGPSPLRHFFGRRSVLGTTTFVLGGLAGAGMHAVLTRTEKPPIVIATAGPPPARVALAAPPPVALRREEKPTPTPPRRAAHPLLTSPALHDSDSVAEPDTELAAERALIETAQTAMARGDAPAALDTLERSMRRFPSGRLEEERESLRVQCLVQVGRYAEARGAGERFRKRFPTSMMLGVVNAALNAIP